MASLLCSVCQQFDDRLRGMRNYSDGFVTEAANLRSSNFKDHGRTDTVWPENLTGIKFDEITSKLHNKNMTDFKFDEMPGKKAHIV